MQDCFTRLEKIVIRFALIRTLAIPLLLSSCGENSQESSQSDLSPGETKTNTLPDPSKDTSSVKTQHIEMKCEKEKQRGLMLDGDEGVYLGMTLKSFLALPNKVDLRAIRLSETSSDFSLVHDKGSPRIYTSYTFEANCPATLRQIMVTYQSDFDLDKAFESRKLRKEDALSNGGIYQPIEGGNWGVRIWRIDNYLGTGNLVGIQANLAWDVKFKCSIDGQDLSFADVSKIDGDPVLECPSDATAGGTGASNEQGSTSQSWREPYSILTWNRGSLGSLTWNDAKLACERSMSRIPDILELETAHRKGILTALKMNLVESKVWSADDGILSGTKKTVDLFGSFPFVSSSNNDSFTRNYVLCVSP